MTKLSVNVNKIATLRNARGNNMPNLDLVTSSIIDFGADVKMFFLFQRLLKIK
jgi:pyridoxine 5-phosphate synthase